MREGGGGGGGKHLENNISWFHFVLKIVLILLKWKD